MRKNFWDRRIPTLLGILVIVIGVGVTTFLVNKGVIFVSKAAPGQEPQNVRITNISDNSFTVSYLTSDSVTGSLSYGSDKKLGQNALDDRDQGQSTIKTYKSHYFSVRNLKPTTTYYFTITSGSTSYYNNGSFFLVTTGASIGSPSDQKPIVGKIITDGNNISDTVIYLTTADSQVISALVKSDGSYLIPLNSVRNSTLTSYFNFSSDSILRMLIISPMGNSNVSASINQINPIPPVILGKDYDFTQSQNPVSTPSGSLSSFPSLTSTSSANIKITSPTSGQGLTDQKPEFKGTAVPNKDVQIIIHSDSQINTTVKTDSSGNWSYRPTTPLSPGQHTISIITTDASGLVKTITESFTVYAAGTQLPNGTTTISPTPIPSATPLPTSTPTPTVLPTATPTPLVTVAPTPVITVTPFIDNSASATPTIFASPTASVSPLPASGNPNIILAGFMGIGITIFAALLFLLSRGSFTI